MHCFFSGLYNSPSDPRSTTHVPFKPSTISTMQSLTNWPDPSAASLGSSVDLCGFLESGTGKWGLADCDGPTRVTVCQWKGSNCPVGYYWLVDQCVGVRKNYNPVRTDRNCRPVAGNSPPGRLLRVTTSDYVGQKLINEGTLVLLLCFSCDRERRFCSSTPWDTQRKCFIRVIMWITTWVK